MADGTRRGGARRRASSARAHFAAGLERRVAARRERAADERAVEPRRRARNRAHAVGSRQVGRRGEQHARVRVPRCVVQRPRSGPSRRSRRRTSRPPSADLRDDRQVVGDQDDREAELVREPRAGARGSAPAPSRRAPSSARRRAAPRVARERHGDRRALAHAAGELVREAARALGADADQLEQLPQRAFARRCRCAVPCSSIGSAIWSPMRCTGLNAFIAPWNTIAMSLPAVRARRDSSPRARMSSPSSRTRPAMLALCGSSPMIARMGVVLPHPDSPTRPIRSPRCEREADALHGVQLAAVAEVEPDVQVLDRRGPAPAHALRPRAGRGGAGGSAAPRGG